MDNHEIIDRLFKVIEGRKTADPRTSYVARLYERGRQKIAQKVGEEAVETVISATANDRDGTIDESVDLLFHLMILWADMGLTPDDIFEEMVKREGISGVYEKKNRPA